MIKRIILILVSIILFGCDNAVSLKSDISIIVGDSLVYMNEWEIDSYGIPGATVDNLMNNFIDISNYDSVFILIGVNNLALKDSPEFVKSEMDRFIESIGNKNIYVISLLPLNNNLKPFPTNDLVIETNYLFSEYSNLIDIYDLFSIGENGNNSYTVVDGIHLSNEGYKVLEQSIY